LQKRENIYQIKKLSKKINNIKGINLLINTFTNYDQKSMKMIIDQLKKELKISIIIFINKNKNDFTVIIRVTKNLINYITALKIINIFIKKANGKGGGKKEIAEGGGMNIKKLPMILNYIKSWITIQLENIKTKNFNN
jgi:alanyl-tRNA synthetase